MDRVNNDGKRNKDGNIVLPPAIFDVLELSALVHHGIGSGCLSQDVERGATCQSLPVCVMGHALWLDGNRNPEDATKVGPVTKRVAKAFGFEPEQYDSVFSINDANVDNEFETRGLTSSREDAYRTADGSYPRRRVSFKRWCKLVGVVRGKDRAHFEPNREEFVEQFFHD